MTAQAAGHTVVIPRVAGAVVVALAALVGWRFDVRWLTGYAPGQEAMSPATALGLGLLGLALWLWAARAPAPQGTWVPQACAALAALIGLVRLSGYAFGFDPGVAPHTASALLLIAVALLLQHRRTRRAELAVQLSALAASVGALLSITAHAYEARFLSGAMALSTALAILLLAVGVLWSHPDHGVAAAFANPAAGGVLIRRFVPAIIVIPLLLGWLRLVGQRAGLYDTAGGTALFVVSIIVVLAAFAAWNVRAVDRADSERRAAEQALRDSEHRLFQILEAMPVAVFVLDATGRPYYANHASRDILGRGIVPSAAADRLPEIYQAFVAGTNDPYPPERQPIVKAIGGEHAYVADIEIHRPDRHVPIEVWAAPVRDAAGRVVFALAAFSDITERRRVEETLRRYAAQLESANAELDAFAYSVSHDLRAPLRSIDGFSQALLDDCAGQLDAAGRDHLQRVRAATQRMGTLIDDLLNLSRVTRSQMTVGPVDLSRLAREVAAELRNGDPARQVEFVIAPGLVASADAGLMRVVLQNLIGNAWKFTGKRPDARIEFGTASANEGPAFYVRDNGAGFDMAYADRLFAAFHRLHGMTEFSGTGIGLATVQRIILRHGGKVWAQAAPDRGATLYFTLA